LYEIFYNASEYLSIRSNGSWRIMMHDVPWNLRLYGIDGLTIIRCTEFNAG